MVNKKSSATSLAQILYPSSVKYFDNLPSPAPISNIWEPLGKELNAFFKDFKKSDEIWRKRLKEKKVTEEDYRKWLETQIFQGKLWKLKIFHKSSNQT